MKGTTAKKVPFKWPKGTLKKLLPTKRKIYKTPQVARVQTCALFTLTSCKIFTVENVQPVVIRTTTAHNKRCSVLNKQVICFL